MRYMITINLEIFDREANSQPFYGDLQNKIGR